MDDKLKNALYERYTRSCRPQYFASWAKPKASELNILRHRHLGGNKEVIWDIAKDSGKAADHIEMAGFYASAIISYGKNKDGELKLMKHLTVPTLRFKPDLTESSFSHNFNGCAAVIKQNGMALTEYPETVSVKGDLSISSRAGDKTEIIRRFTPAVDQPALIETVTVFNRSDKPQKYEASGAYYSESVNAFWCVGDKNITAESSAVFGDIFEPTAQRSHEYEIAPGDCFTFYCVYYAYQTEMLPAFSIHDEIAKRDKFISNMFGSLRLESGVPELDAQFAHCILRGSESIFKTAGGLMHAPGGGSYYAALWTNDQCEYANPFFPFSGYKAGIDQCINCYSAYENYMDRSDKPMREKRPLVSSVIAEGRSFWNGAGDRGDCEMYAYGLTRFLLEMSDIALIKRFWDDIIWCLDFALSHKNNYGVIESDSDELENRFESGNANLFTSCLTYDALGNAAALAKVMGDAEHAKLWTDEREKLRNSIEEYFGGNVEGFETYKYYDGNRDLRAWICMPLTVEIFDRADETVKALFSPRLYMNGMLRSTSASNTTWDRSLLFALRGTLLAGKADIGTEQIVNYCKNRLLGSHCPYPFEAYPEGNRAHLAAESLLFARVVTEGLFGLRAVGLNRLRIKPQLSGLCPSIKLSGIRLFSKQFDISADSSGIKLEYDGKTYSTESREAVFDFNTLKFE